MTTDNVDVASTTRDQLPFLRRSAILPSARRRPRVASDGTSTTTITVTLHDALGRPSPGKMDLDLAGYGGHSVITGPCPAVTDASGQIQFTATDGVSETVVYTAVDVTDGDLAGAGLRDRDVHRRQRPRASAAPPVAARASRSRRGPPASSPRTSSSATSTGAAVPGASNPTFTPSGTALVADFRTGDLFKFGLDGGSVRGQQACRI